MTHHQPIRAAIYGRVSSDRQEEADTIASQLAALRARVSQDKLSLREDLCFIDDGYSGTTLIRPALDRLRDAAAAGILNRLYIHSPDRLARKYAYQVLLVDEFQRCGVEVIFLNRPLDGSAEDQLLLQVQGKIAEYERRLGDGSGEKPSFVEEPLERQLAKVRSGLARLIDSYQEGLLEKHESEPRLRAARERPSRLEAQAKEIEDRRDQDRALRLAIQGLEDFAERVQAGLTTANWHDRREIIRAIVKRVEVGTEEIRVVYRVSPPPFVSAPSGSGGTFEHCGDAPLNRP